MNIRKIPVVVLVAGLIATIAGILLFITPIVIKTDFNENGIFVLAGIPAMTFCAYTIYCVLNHKIPSRLLITVSILICLIVFFCSYLLAQGQWADTSDSYCTGLGGVRTTCYENALSAVAVTTTVLLILPVIPILAIVAIMYEIKANKKNQAVKRKGKKKTLGRLK